MIRNVSIKLSTEGRNDLYDVQFDGVQVADKLDMLSVFIEPGKIPHMILSVPFRNLEVNNVHMNVDSYVNHQKEEDDDESTGNEDAPISGTPDDCA